MNKIISRKYSKYGFALILLTFVLSYCIYNPSAISIWTISKKSKITVKNDKLILVWTGTFGSKAKLKNWYISKELLQNRKFSCKLSDEKSDIEKADAVVFHGASWDGKLSPPPKYRNPKQIWIFFHIETPVRFNLNNLGDGNSTRHFYNWTATYRSDSDVYLPYGRFKLRSAPIEMPRSKSNEKKGLIAWMVSNCNPASKRNKIVQELEKFVKINRFGKCSSNRCNDSMPTCYKNLGSKYKFYLSFENSLCVDYVTEKYYNALKYGMVPIVYGWANYTKISPPNSFINVGDFSSLEKLGNYINFLDNNQTAYEKYLEWTKTYTVEVHGSSWKFYEICNKLYEKSSGPKFYEDLDKWWSNSNYNPQSASCENKYNYKKH